MPSQDFSTQLSKEQSLRSERLKKSVTDLAQQIGERSSSVPGSLDKAADYISEQFRSRGYEVSEMSYSVSDENRQTQTYRNIIAEKEDSLPTNSVIVVGAHYDTCFNPGADDNASGVASLFELANMIQQQKTKHRIRFVAFTNEEPPFFHTSIMGSRVYAREIKKRGEKLRAAVILEMLGFYSNKRFSQRYIAPLGLFFPNKANFVAFIGNFRSRKTVQLLESGFKSSSRFPIRSIVLPEKFPAVNFSDHDSFWKEGYQAIMVTDTAMFRNPHYHQSSDKPATLDYKSMSAMLEGLAAAITKLANT